MSDENPYSAPDSELVEQPNDDFIVHEPRSLPASDGWRWLADGFTYFKLDPGTWIGIMIIGFIIMLVLNFIPFINMVAGFTTYIWMGGLMLGCKAQYENQPLKIEHLFAGFTNQLGNLLGVGIVSSVLTMLIFYLTMKDTGLALMSGSEVNPETLQLTTDFALSFAIAMALVLPIIMFVWFAPALIIINKLPLMTAMKMSFQGCIRNVLPFLVYGIVSMVLLFFAALPLGLGLLIVVPMIYASIFRSYHQIFIE